MFKLQIKYDTREHEDRQEITELEQQINKQVNK